MLLGAFWYFILLGLWKEIFTFNFVNPTDALYTFRFQDTEVISYSTNKCLRYLKMFVAVFKLQSRSNSGTKRLHVHCRPSAFLMMKMLCFSVLWRQIRPQTHQYGAWNNTTHQRTSIDCVNTLLCPEHLTNNAGWIPRLMGLNFICPPGKSIYIRLHENFVGHTEEESYCSSKMQRKTGCEEMAADWL